MSLPTPLGLVSVAELILTDKKKKKKIDISIFLPQYHHIIVLGIISRFRVVCPYHRHRLQNVLAEDSGAYYEWSPLE